MFWSQNRREFHRPERSYTGSLNRSFVTFRHSFPAVSLTKNNERRLSIYYYYLNICEKTGIQIVDAFVLDAEILATQRRNDDFHFFVEDVCLFF